MPSRAATRCPLTHGLELEGYLLQRVTGRGDCDVGDQADQPIVTSGTLGPAKQVRLDDSFIHKPAHGSP